MARGGSGRGPGPADFAPEPGQRAALQRYAREWLPGVDADSLTDISCTYTTTVDENFVLDRIGPVVIGAGFSGHGFKFTPVVGRILADLATGDGGSAGHLLGLPAGRPLRQPTADARTTRAPLARRHQGLGCGLLHPGLQPAQLDGGFGIAFPTTSSNSLSRSAEPACLTIVQVMSTKLASRYRSCRSRRSPTGPRGSWTGPRRAAAPVRCPRLLSP